MLAPHAILQSLEAGREAKRHLQPWTQAGQPLLHPIVGSEHRLPATCSWCGHEPRWTF